MIPEQQTASQPINFTPANNTVEHPLIFMGGVGYDEAKNARIAGKIIGLTGNESVLSIPDIAISTEPKYGTAIYEYDDGTRRELPGKLALKHLDEEPRLRYTRMHEQKAELLLKAIEDAGGNPVDAVFQSADASTGIIAIRKRPDLFRKVVLLDPSSIAKLPPRAKYFAEEWRNGNIMTLLKHRQNKPETPVNNELHEAKKRPTFKERTESRLQDAKNVISNRRSGNTIASYISSQAPMLHEIAQSESAPSIYIMSSRFDHAYTPERLLKSLVSLDDVKGFFVTNFRHGISGKQEKLEQLAGVLKGLDDNYLASSFMGKLHFFKDVSEEYRQKILEILKTRIDK